MDIKNYSVMPNVPGNQFDSVLLQPGTEDSPRIQKYMLLLLLKHAIESG